MNLTEEQIDRIEALLVASGVDCTALRADLLDHICSDIESADDDFETALAMAMKKFGGVAAMGFLQRQTRVALQHREKVKLRQAVHRLRNGFWFFAILAAMFKMMHWPMGNALLTISVATGIGLLVAAMYKRSRYAKMEKLTT